MAKAKTAANMKGRRTQVMLYLDPPVVEVLRAVKAKTRIPMQELLREAVSDMLSKYQWAEDPLSRRNPRKKRLAS